MVFPFPDRQSSIHKLPKGFDLTAIKERDNKVQQFRLGLLRDCKVTLTWHLMTQCVGRLRFCPNTALVWLINRCSAAPTRRLELFSWTSLDLWLSTLRLTAEAAAPLLALRPDRPATKRKYSRAPFSPDRYRFWCSSACGDYEFERYSCVPRERLRKYTITLNCGERRVPCAGVLTDSSPNVGICCAASVLVFCFFYIYFL